MKRPLVQITLLYVIGLLLGEFLNTSLAVVLLCAIVTGGACLLLSKFRKILLCPFIILTAWSNSAFHRGPVSPYDVRIEFGSEPRIVTLQGTLRSTPKEKLFVWEDQETWRSVVELEVSGYRKRNDWLPVVGKVFVNTPDRLPAHFFKGQVVEITGVLSPPRGPLAEGLFDYRTYLQRKGIYHQLKTASTNDWVLVETGKMLPLSDRFVRWTKQALLIGLKEDDTTHLLWTLVLDWKAVFTDEAEEPFMRAGTYHIFAVDGLRIAIVTGILVGLLRLLQVPRGICGLIIIPSIWFYTGVTDFPASAIRASIMMTVVILGWSLKRPTDLINSLFAAAIIILFWEPQQLFQAGFQLSFFVVLAIALLSPVMEHLRQKLMKSDPFLPDELRSPWRKRLDPVVVYLQHALVSSWVAWIGSIPLSAYYFHLLSPVSTPANFLVVPLTCLTLISCLISMLVSWIPPLAAVFNHCSWGLMKSISWISEWSVTWPGTWCYVSTPSLLTIVTFYLFLLTLHTHWFWVTKRKGPIVAILAVVGVAWVGYEIHDHQFTRVHILPLSGGHAVYVETPKAKDRLLVDCGNESSAAFVVKPFLRAHGVNQLPRFVLTHGDLRYMGGADIIRTNFWPKELVTSPLRARSSAYRQFLDLNKTSNNIVRTIAVGEQLNNWRVLHPDPEEPFGQADDNALVLKGEFGSTRILLCADLGRNGQRSLIGRTNDLSADVIVSGLPRQEEPLSDDLLQAVKARLLLVADTESPATERASPKLRQRLARQTNDILYTRETGSVLIETDLKTYKVVTSQ